MEVIGLDKINEIIDATPMITDIRKEFYKKMIRERYNKILKFSMDKMNQRDVKYGLNR